MLHSLPCGALRQCEHHQLRRRESEQTLRASGEQRTLICYSPWGHKELDLT